MKSIILAALAAIGVTGAAHAQPLPPDRYQAAPRDGGRYAQFDVRNADGWAERLVLCDTTAFLASRPNLNADRMWVRRDDGRRDLLLPPYFVGGGRWYKEGYERLFWRLRRQRQVSSDELYRIQDSLGRRFVLAYRDGAGFYGGGADSRFLERQDSYCRSMARAQGVIVS